MLVENLVRCLDSDIPDRYRNQRILSMALQGIKYGKLYRHHEACVGNGAPAQAGARGHCSGWCAPTPALLVRSALASKRLITRREDFEAQYLERFLCSHDFVQSCIPTCIIAGIPSWV